MTTWIEIVWLRLAPNPVAVPIPALTVVECLLAALTVIVVNPVWRLARLVVTLVHELGHALTGILTGMRFKGFVIKSDMSGHAVLSGSGRGLGRVLTSWAGYPAPAFLGAALIWSATSGWAAPLVGAVLVVLLVALIKARSVLTTFVTVTTFAGTTALWWWRQDVLQASVLLTLGLVLLLGGWRHLGAVLTSGDGGDDPGTLKKLTHVPRFVWVTSYAAVFAAASWFVANRVLAIVG